MKDFKWEKCVVLQHIHIRIHVYIHIIYTCILYICIFYKFKNIYNLILYCSCSLFPLKEILYRMRHMKEMYQTGSYKNH